MRVLEDKNNKNQENKDHKTQRNLRVVPKGKNLIANDTVYISNGKILHNAFSKRLENSEASQWILENENLVKASIYKWIRTLGVQGGNVEDCYDLLLYEYNSRTDLDFNKNYFGKESGYGIKEYILSRVHSIVRRYQNKMRDENITPLLTQDESDYFMGEIEENFERDDGLGQTDRIVEEDLGYWDALYTEMLGILEAFLEERYYTEFDYEIVINYLYLEVDEFDGVQDIEKHYNYVSDKTGETLELIETIVEDMTEAVKDGDVLGSEILIKIQELLKGKESGWVSKRLRDKK